MTIDAEIRGFIAENFLFTDDASGLEADASLLEQGLIDSTGVLELVAFLEDRFGLSVADAEIVPENLDSVAALVAFVTRKQQAATAAA